MSAVPRDANSMEQVRELLFGAQLKEIEERLHRQEEQIARELAALRDEVRSGLQGLEGALSGRLEAEARQRGADKNESGKELARLQADLEKRAAALAASLDKSESSLKALISSENVRITSAVEARYKSALASLSESTAQIREDMVDRSAISALLMDLAGKLAPAGPDKTGKQG